MKRNSSKIMTTLVIIVFSIILAFTGYMFLGHEDSKFQEWLTDLKEDYKEESEQNDTLYDGYVKVDPVSDAGTYIFNK